MPLLSGVLLGGLHLHRDPGRRQRGDDRRDRFADLEVDRAVLDLHHGVRAESAGQRRELVVRRMHATRGLDVFVPRDHE